MDELEEILKTLKNFAANDKKTIMSAYFDGNPKLGVIISKYEKNKSKTTLKTELNKFIAKEDINLQNSPLTKSKLSKYYSFRHIVEEIQENMKMISKKQLKLFNYLYIEEDISVLAAYEVFLLTGDINDLVESLLLIDKLNFFSNKLDFDEIEQFDENMEEQFDIIYTFKKHLSLELRQTLEKFIRIGDKSLIEMYDEYKKHQNKEKFLEELKKFAQETTGKLQIIEKQIHDQKEEEETVNKVSDRKDQLRRFQTQKFLPELDYMSILDDWVDSNHKLIESIFTVYEMTKDKMEFIEDIQLVYKRAYKEKIKEVVKNGLQKNYLSFGDADICLKHIETSDEFIIGAFEVYMSQTDIEGFPEFCDSMKIFASVKIEERENP